MEITKLIDAFATSLFSRSGILTEDNVRYSLYHYMLAQDPDLNHYTLELPYDSIRRELCPNIRLVKDHGLKTLSDSKQKSDETYDQVSEEISNSESEGKLNQSLDMYYDNGLEQICIEVKFHRHLEGGSTYAHPQAAGQLVNDFRRLQQLTPTDENQNFKRMMLYVTDTEMYNYITVASGSANKQYRQALKSFFENGDLNCPKDAPDTFINNASKSFNTKSSNFDVRSNVIENRVVACPGCTSIYPNDPARKKLYIRLYEIDKGYNNNIENLTK